MSREQPECAPNARLFILGGKGLSEQDWKDTFGEYGTVTNVWIQYDRYTKEQKGYCNITFSKASEAFLAKEKLSGKNICGIPKPIRCIIDSEDRKGKDDDEEDRFLTLCVKVKSEWTEKDVTDEFSQYGEIDRINIMNPRGDAPDTLAFIRYHSTVSAALGLEGCDPSYKAMYPSKKKKREREDPDDRDRGRGRGYGRDSERGSRRPLMPDPHAAPDLLAGYGRGCHETCLEVITPAALPQELYRGLFDLVPGMEVCDMDDRTGVAYVRYATPAAAAYALEKLRGFEYPPGKRLGVRYIAERGDSRSNFRGNESRPPPRAYNDVRPRHDPYDDVRPGRSRGHAAVPDNLQSVVSSLQFATQALAKAGIDVPGIMADGARGGGMDEGYSRGDYKRPKMQGYY